MRNLKRLAAATMIATALLASACGSSGSSGHASDTTSPTTAPSAGQNAATDTSAPAGAADPAAGTGRAATASHVDPAAASKAISEVEKLVPPMHGAVSRTTYDVMLRATCDATVTGAADQRKAAATASAIVAKLPAGPSKLAQYRTGMILLAETYLSIDHCDAPPSYAASVVTALEPHASQALIDMTNGS